MFKSGLIVGAIAFVYLFVGSIAMSICTPGEAIILGLLAGALAAYFDKAALAEKAAVSGGVAGLIAGVIGVIGDVIGTLIKTYVVFTPSTVSSLASQITGMSASAYDTSTSTAGTFAAMCCCAIVDLILIAGLGALGGFLWHQYKGRNAAPKPPQITA